MNYFQTPALNGIKYSKKKKKKRRKIKWTKVKKDKTT